MSDKKLIQALRRLSVENRPLCCMGCGHEHNCSIHGCAVIREAMERIGAAETQQNEEHRCENAAVKMA